jgi:hypothetical protein
MKKRQNSKEDIENIAERAQLGIDVSKYFSGRPVAKQRVNIDFPLGLLRKIDADCREIGITRQAWIKIACDERLRKIEVRAVKDTKAS